MHIQHYKKHHFCVIFQINEFFAKIDKNAPKLDFGTPYFDKKKSKYQKSQRTFQVLHLSNKRTK